MIRNLSAPQYQAFRTRLGQIEQTARNCDMGSEPSLFAEFVDRSLTAEVDRLDSKSPEASYIKMVRTTGRSLASHPHALVSLWSSALRTVQGGIPGTAGVALAKTAASLAGAYPQASSTLAHQVIGRISNSAGQVETNPAASKAVRGYFDTVDATANYAPADKDALALKTMNDIAAINEWNIA